MMPNLSIISLNSTIPDLDDTFHAEKMKERGEVVNEKIRRASNLFNTTSHTAHEVIPPKVCRSEKRVALEKNEAEWRAFLIKQMETNKSLKRAAEELSKTEPLDGSILNNDQKNFFDSAINCEKWLQHSTEFRQKALDYIERKADFKQQQEFVKEMVRGELNRTTLPQYPQFSFRNLAPNINMVEPSKREDGGDAAGQ